MKLVQVQKIWDYAPHNAFTDLIRFKGQWFCVFREAETHHSANGALRIIRSADAKTWVSVALITAPCDLRDGKLSITPDKRLMLCGFELIRKDNKRNYQSFAWFSEDGSSWSEGKKIGDLNYWLWRITWHKNVAYSIAYRCDGLGNSIRLYSKQNADEFAILAENLIEEGSPNEASLIFYEDQAYCLLRREKANGLLGIAAPPYKQWIWKDLTLRIGGPHLIALPDGRLIAAVRLYDEPIRTSLGYLHPDTGQFRETLALPSGGDTSYPGLVYYDEHLWVSYYSSHEGKTSIYLAQVQPD